LAEISAEPSNPHRRTKIQAQDLCLFLARRHSWHSLRKLCAGEHYVLGAQCEVVHHGQLGNSDAAINDHFPRRVRCARALRYVDASGISNTRRLMRTGRERLAYANEFCRFLPRKIGGGDVERTDRHFRNLRERQEIDSFPKPARMARSGRRAEERAQRLGDHFATHASSVSVRSSARRVKFERFRKE
jgi:hypothetical protein